MRGTYGGGASLSLAADAVANLKNEEGADLVILGSGELIRSLARRGLIDQYTLLVHPLVHGAGLRMFGDDGTFARFRLVDSVPTTTGVIITTYERAQRVHP